MSLASQTNSCAAHTKAAYEAIAEMGGELPEHKNLENMPASIDSISVTEEGDGTLWGTLYTTAYPNGIVLNSHTDYDALGNTNNSSSTISVNGLGIVKNTIKKYSFGAACSYTPSSFLNNCTQLNAVTSCDPVIIIGNRFCQGTSINQALIFPNVLEVGDFFFYQTGVSADITFSMVKKIGRSFMQSVEVGAYAGLHTGYKLSLGNKLEEIGYGFMSTNDSSTNRFDQPLDIPQTVNSIGSYFMRGLRNFIGPLKIDTTTLPSDDDAGDYQSQYTLSVGRVDCPAYIQGVTITGAGAPVWKGALPNRTSTPYRKLILVEE